MWAMPLLSQPCSKLRRRLLPSMATSLPPDSSHHRAIHCLEAALEGVGVQSGEDVAEGVVGGNAVGQFQEVLQPRLLGPAIVGHRHPSSAAAETANRAMVKMSISLWRRLFRRGSGIRIKAQRNLRGRLASMPKLLKVIRF